MPTTCCCGCIRTPSAAATGRRWRSISPTRSTRRAPADERRWPRSRPASLGDLVVSLLREWTRGGGWRRRRDGRRHAAALGPGAAAVGVELGHPAGAARGTRAGAAGHARANCSVLAAAGAAAGDRRDALRDAPCVNATRDVAATTRSRDTIRGLRKPFPRGRHESPLHRVVGRCRPGPDVCRRRRSRRVRVRRRPPPNLPAEFNTQTGQRIKVTHGGRRPVPSLEPGVRRRAHDPGRRAQRHACA